MTKKGLIGVQMSTIAPNKMPKFDAYESMARLAEIGYKCIEISQVPMTEENVKVQMRKGILEYCILAILLAGDAIRLFANFIVINDLNDAGAWGNSALLTITVLLLLYCDLESQGKAAWVLSPISAFLLLICLLSI